MKRHSNGDGKMTPSTLCLFFERASLSRMANDQDVIASIDLVSTTEKVSEELTILDVLAVSLTLIKDLSPPIEAQDAVDYDDDDDDDNDDDEENQRVIN
jgi:hypothetical protein